MLINNIIGFNVNISYLIQIVIIFVCHKLFGIDIFICYMYILMFFFLHQFACYLYTHDQKIIITQENSEICKIKMNV